MLALKQTMALNTIKGVAAWSPLDEETVVAWYRKATGITLNGSNVSQWSDQTTNNRHMVQATANEQPAYSAGILTFDPTTYTQNLQTTGQISLSGTFTIGFRANPSTFNNVILGDNTTSNEFFKYNANDRLSVKIDGTIKHLDLDSGTFGNDYIVITRDGSNVLTLYKNGTAQSATQTLAGTADIDAIGVRATDVNAYDGTVTEIVIFDSISQRLIQNVNSRLSSL